MIVKRRILDFGYHYLIFKKIPLVCWVDELGQLVIPISGQRDNWQIKFSTGFMVGGFLSYCNHQFIKFKRIRDSDSKFIL